MTLISSVFIFKKIEQPTINNFVSTNIHSLTGVSYSLFIGHDGHSPQVYDVLQPGPLRDETQHSVNSLTCPSRLSLNVSCKRVFFPSYCFHKQADRQTKNQLERTMSLASLG